jgi:hypothetical protein
MFSSINTNHDTFKSVLISTIKHKYKPISIKYAKYIPEHFSKYSGINKKISGTLLKKTL